RQQAGRVAHWTEPVGELSETIIIVNRSLDPVTNVELWWYAPDANIDPAKHEWVFMAFETNCRRRNKALATGSARCQNRHNPWSGPSDRPPRPWERSPCVDVRRRDRR
ncbi:hypothetical protein ACFQ9H_31075, partial [Streptomyces sp. NPDC056517]|uniref:hypothetical protein n=1 Tax=Streptomyces sp. NPDC056517 TaxID=3345848 RepID=UPI0036C3D55D